MTLDEAPRAARVVVTGLSAVGASRRRLMDLGVLPGVQVVVESASPLGDPTAYRIRGSLIALRAEQARCIQVAPGESSR